jgi:predicted RNA binding protein YcfA (HicA-like mRNA interferase family)
MRIPPHSGKDMIAALERAGFFKHHQRGSHVYLFSKDKKLARPLTVPLYRELPDFIVFKNLKTAGISPTEYLNLLGKGRNKK